VEKNFKLEKISMMHHPAYYFFRAARVPAKQKTPKGSGGFLLFQVMRR